MPTYTVTAPQGRLSNDQKHAIARAITRTHNEVTGAPIYFAQTLFVEISAGSYFVGGEPLDVDQVFVRGEIRAGRSEDDKHKLIVALTEAVAEGAAMRGSQIWVYIAELAASQMVEFGKILPLPGAEADWIAGFPTTDRERLQAIGRVSAV